MKKLFLSLVAVIVAATATYAQNTLVATLTHGTDVTMYYGTYALRDAYNAAVSGDVINLSGGAFQAVDIEKAVKLRGAGIDATSSTYINNSFTINIPTTDAGRLELEGIRITSSVTMTGSFSNTYFLRCQLSQVSFDYERAAIKNVMFANCKITDGLWLRGSSTLQVINSYINNVAVADDNSSASFVNCVIKPSGGYEFGSITNSQLLNCIFDYGATWYFSPLSSTSIATNCVVVNCANNVFDQSQANTGNALGVSYTDMFKTYTGTYTDTETFELADAAKSKYLGTDGTQVGMYGGVLPYNSTPSYPQITKMNVANKTTADGKLSVEIEVSAAN